MMVNLMSLGDMKLNNFQRKKPKKSTGSCFLLSRKKGKKQDLARMALT